MKMRKPSSDDKASRLTWRAFGIDRLRETLRESNTAPRMCGAITTPHVPLPAADGLEDAAVPSVGRIVDAVLASAG